MRRITIIFFFSLSLTAAVFCSCERKSLLLENTAADLHLTVETEDPVLGPLDAGKTYRSLSFDAAKDSQDGYSFTGPEGGRISVRAGEKAVIVHTFGCEAAYVAGDQSLQGAHVTTNRADYQTQALWAETLSLSEAAAPWDTLSVRWEPDRMWAASTGRLSVPRRDEGDSFGLEATARPVFRTLRVFLTDVEGMPYIASATAFIAGASAGRRLVDDTALAERCSVQIPMYRASQTALIGQAAVFGFGEGPVRLFVMLTDTGKEKYVYEYDITEDCHSDVRVMTLYSGIAVEEPENTGGGGFLPSLEDWNTKVVPVRL